MNGNHTITLAELNGGTGIKAKRSIIAIGGDIIIDANISLRDYPIVLIALTDGTGNGGNIRIK